MRDFVRCVINGSPFDLRGRAVFAPVSDLLRRDLGLTGTKVVCAEGDCGSCAVLLGRPAGDSVVYRTVCSCILYGGQLDGCHLVTIEGLRYGDTLNPVQSAMVACQGTQCGFCTPGIVVAMCGMFDADPAMTGDRLRRGLVGNLCRCTGYEPIIAAGMAVDTSALKRIDDLYPATTIRPMLLADGTLRVSDGDMIWHAPATTADAVAFRLEHPGCIVLAGGTDVGVQLNKGVRPVTTILSLATVSSMKSLDVTADSITAGAGVSLADLEAKLCESIPEFGRFLRWFGSPPIKNAGTIGGNVATGSPIGDTLPALMVLDAAVELTGPTGTRRVDLNHFYTGYRESVATADELITAVVIPVPDPGDLFKIYKVSKRKDLDISTLSAAIRVRVDGGTMTAARLAFGGVGPTVVRLPEVERLLVGRSPTEELFDEAADRVSSQVKPIGDVRGSAGYRSAVAGNLLRKFYFDVFEYAQTGVVGD